MTQSEQIAKQVALKAAVDLAKDKFNVENNITEQLEVIKQISNNLYEHIKPVVAFQEPSSVVEKEPMNEQKVTYKYTDEKPAVNVGYKPKFEAKCPSCGSKVWDNRETAKDKQPKWKCGNKDGCDTGKGYAWASWNEDEFDNQIKKFMEEQTPTEKVDLEDLEPPF